MYISYNNMSLEKSQKTVLDLVGLKMVKGANSENHNGIFKISHYDTEILSHDFNKNQTTIKLNCSKTSDKMIYRVLTVLDKNIENCINTHKGKKYNYAGVNE